MITIILSTVATILLLMFVVLIFRSAKRHERIMDTMKCSEFNGKFRVESDQYGIVDQDWHNNVVDAWKIAAKNSRKI